MNSEGITREMPDKFYFEKKFWERGYKNIAGTDEVGRGCLAGPVVCAAVIFERSILGRVPKDIIIDDSKKLSDKRRRIAASWIKTNAKSWAVGLGSVAEISRRGIVCATNLGFRRSATSLQRICNTRVDYLLIDAFYVPYIRGIRMPSKKARKMYNDDPMSIFSKNDGRQLAITKGDEKIFSISAASIIAKVARDDMMIELSQNPSYRKYGWHCSKGYGTVSHLLAIKKYGITRHHRKDFIHLKDF